ncbi:MAG: hydrolase [bacterium]
MKRHPQILNRKQTALLIVDVQERINAVMHHRQTVVESILKLIKTCQILDVPIFITEQYPKGLGATEAEILAALGDTTPIQKMTFSCCGDAGLLTQLEQKNIRQVIVTGIECHVCVQQTALDLLAHHLQVHIPRDAVSSRKLLDYETALDRMAKTGAVLTTVESAVFELLEKAGTTEFKQVARLIK